MHQAADGEVGHQQAIELLAHQFRSLGAQLDLGAAQVCLQFVEGGLDLPTLVIEGGQFRGRGLGGVEDGGGQPVGKAVFSWHNCVVKTWFLPCGGGLSDDRV